MNDNSRLVKRIEVKEGGGTTVCDGAKIELLYKVAKSWEDFDNGVFIESNYHPEEHICVEYKPAELMQAVYDGINGMKSGGGVRRFEVQAPSASSTSENLEGVRLFIEITLHALSMPGA